MTEVPVTDDNPEENAAFHPPNAERSRTGGAGWWRREFSSLLVLVLLLLFLALAQREFFDSNNIRDILVENSYVFIAGIGATIVILAAGIDISIGSMLAACSVTAGVLARNGLPLPVVILATLGMGSVLGLINGIFVARLQLPPIIVTLATMSIYRGAVTWYTQGQWIQNLPASFTYLGQGSFLGIPIPVWVAAFTAIAAAAFLQLSRTGRHIYAVGSNPVSAELSGINVNRIRLLTYVLSGFLVGVASLVYASRFSQIQSNTGIGFELTVITAAVVGGTNIFGAVGSVWGTLSGVLLLGSVHPALVYRHISSYWENAIQGSFILLAILGDAIRSKRR
ncbi:MAG: ABC transporter permease [Armatimonadota bacterium]|nr:ABC transporter permease [Armatimonadota bacterium]